MMDRGIQPRSRGSLRYQRKKARKLGLPVDLVDVRPKYNNYVIMPPREGISHTYNLKISLYIIAIAIFYIPISLLLTLYIIKLCNIDKNLTIFIIIICLAFAFFSLHVLRKKLIADEKQESIFATNITEPSNAKKPASQKPEASLENNKEPKLSPGEINRIRVANILASNKALTNQSSDDSTPTIADLDN
ncbi:hypothetical protein [Asticcacaulis sp. YBE204]|uniref:hypothetical protein n=1 Tax=Asticcacaulis sp. YBE204 TaxID=1282363 RepID=UPI0012DC3F54|nr:hypothetical protein [Asticcacaulis sp. YBE204]